MAAAAAIDDAFTLRRCQTAAACRAHALVNAPREMSLPAADAPFAMLLIHRLIISPLFSSFAMPLMISITLSYASH